MKLKEQIKGKLPEHSVLTVVAVISLVFTAYNFYCVLPSDFRIKADPRSIWVDEGATTTTTISVYHKSSLGNLPFLGPFLGSWRNNPLPLKSCDDDVMLVNSTLGTPGISGASIFFSKSDGTPYYESIVTIKVDPTVPPGNYTLVFRGVGGEDHESVYRCYINVNPKEPIAHISDFEDGDKVPQTVLINGTSKSKDIPDGWFLRAFSLKHAENSYWQPQGGRIVPENDHWNVSAQLGRIGKDNGTEFLFAVALVNQRMDQKCQDFLNNTTSTDSHFTITPDEEHSIVWQDHVTLIREGVP